jgi:hypothetical protein
MATTPDSHLGDPGSIPRTGCIFVFFSNLQFLSGGFVTLGELGERKNQF